MIVIFIIFIFLQPNDTVNKDYMMKSMLYKEPVDPANWVGLEKFNSLLLYLRVRRGFGFNKNTVDLEL